MCRFVVAVYGHPDPGTGWGGAMATILYRASGSSMVGTVAVLPPHEVLVSLLSLCVNDLS